MSKHQNISILLVDDDDVDVQAFKRVLGKQGITNPVYVAGDGAEALAVLRGEEGRAKIPYPYVIMLDLKMPRMGGLEFLEELRKDAEHRDSVVFVLTTSDDDNDKTAAYSQHIAGYFLKANANDRFSQIADLLKLFAGTVQFPARKTLTRRY